MRILDHLKDNSGDENISKVIWVAIVFVVGAILLILVTSAFQNPIYNWFRDTVHSWFKGDGPDANGSYPSIDYSASYIDGTGSSGGSGGSGGSGFFGDLDGQP